MRTATMFSDGSAHHLSPLTSLSNNTFRRWATDCEPTKSKWLFYCWPEPLLKRVAPRRASPSRANERDLADNCLPIGVEFRTSKQPNCATKPSAGRGWFEVWKMFVELKSNCKQQKKQCAGMLFGEHFLVKTVSYD